MDYNSSIQDLINAIKADKSVVQPWRNKASARLEEVQAFIRMGKTTSYREIDLEAEGIKPGINHLEVECSCPEGGRKRSCPVHVEGA